MHRQGGLLAGFGVAEGAEEVLDAADLAVVEFTMTSPGAGSRGCGRTVGWHGEHQCAQVGGCRRGRG
ncbi:MAG: hypothetical protein ACRDRH_15935 [Pseudonocardia sp.]